MARRLPPALGRGTACADGRSLAAGPHQPSGTVAAMPATPADDAPSPPADPPTGPASHHAAAAADAAAPDEHGHGHGHHHEHERLERLRQAAIEAEFATGRREETVEQAERQVLRRLARMA